jgi:hypothetical protein
MPQSAIAWNNRFERMWDDLREAFARLHWERVARFTLTLGWLFETVAPLSGETELLSNAFLFDRAAAVERSSTASNRMVIRPALPGDHVPREAARRSYALVRSAARSVPGSRVIRA